jgi:hypothetical protein
MASDFPTAFRDSLLDFLAPATEAASDAVTRAAWLSQLGYTAALSGAPELGTIFAQVGALKTELSALDLSSIDSLSGVQNLLQIGRSLQALISAIKQFGNDPSRANVAEMLAEEVMALLLGNYLRRRHTTLFRVASVLNLVQAAETAQPAASIVQNGATLRFSPYYDQFNFSAIGPLFNNPADVLRQYYFPNNLANALDARVAASRIFGDLGLLLNAVGLGWRTNFALSSQETTTTDNSDDSVTDFPEGFDTSDLDVNEIPPEDVDQIANDNSPLPDSYFATTFPGFRIAILSSSAAPGSDVALELQCSSAAHPGAVAGFIASIAGEFNSVTTFDSWRLTLAANGQIPAFVLKPDGIALAPISSPLTGGKASLLLERLSSSGTGSVFLFGAPSGTRLEIGALSLRGDFSFDPAHITASAGAKAAQCSFVFKPSDGDSFLGSVLPQDGLTAQFDFGLAYSSDGGLFIQGGAGMDVTLPIGVSIGGVVTIPSLYLALTGSTSGLQIEASASAAFSIGPIAVSVDRVGAVLAITFPDGGGNFGPMDLDISFKPPSGAGIAIDAAGVSGGGFLDFDSAHHQYSGVLALKFNDLALQAFGLITTQVAGGTGYSLIALIDADFPPVQLGWGFTLNGVGGLLAIHRTASVDALRAAVKSGKLSSILFPTSPIANAPLVLSTLDTLFPTAPGRFLFGPMALIGWGTPTVLTAALAVIFELDPVEIVLIARLQSTLPTPSAPLVHLNMDALGVLDLSQDELSLDASLFDSKLIDYAITGDMALRANWSSQREFLLAIGGFHPQFSPPAGFPALTRVAINMPSGIVSKLRLAAYLAITSNSVQFGSTLDVFIGVSGCGISGHLGFDALLQFNPFHFSADISGSVAVTVGGDDLASVSLDASLSGPAPWNIAGSFKFHVIFFDVHISFSQSWGQNAPSQQVPAVDVGALLNAALADPRNWDAQLPRGLAALVSTRQVSDANLVFAHPLALLEVHEQVVPLGLAITHFGEALPSGSTEFSITDFRVGTQDPHFTAVQDDFAPAQFFDLSDNDKLSRPSFERHDAGAMMNGNLVANGNPQAKSIDYETFYINTPGVVTVDEGVPQPFPWGDIIGILRTGAAARKTISRAGKLGYAAPGNPVQIVEPSFSIASVATLAAASLPSAGTTYSDMAAALQATITSAPSQRGNLQIVGDYELVEAA